MRVHTIRLNLKPNTFFKGSRFTANKPVLILFDRLNEDLSEIRFRDVSPLPPPQTLLRRICSGETTQGLGKVSVRPLKADNVYIMLMNIFYWSRINRDSDRTIMNTSPTHKTK